MTTQQLRRKHRNEPGNGGKFTTHDRTGPETTLTQYTPAQQQWDADLFTAADFYRNHKTIPSRFSDNPNEATIGLWVVKQRRKLRLGTLTPEEAAALDLVIPGWDKGRQGRPTQEKPTIRLGTPEWYARADELTDFYTINNAMPTTWSTDPAERDLAEWFSSARQRIEQRRAEGSAKHDEAYRYLSDRIPWRVDFEARWQEQAQELQAFKEQHGHWPRKGGTLPEEHRLYLWLNNQRSQAAGTHNNPQALTPQRRAFLDKRLPGWNPDRKHTDWRARASEVAEFVHQHSRVPQYQANDEEAPLYHWLAKQRLRSIGKRRRPLTPEQRTYLDENVPGWSSTPTHINWHARANEVIEFKRKHSRWPSTLRAEEAQLARWLTRQRSKARGQTKGPLAPEHRAFLDKHIPDWLTTTSRPASEPRR